MQGNRRFPSPFNSFARRRLLEFGQCYAAEKHAQVASQASALHLVFFRIGDGQALTHLERITLCALRAQRIMQAFTWLLQLEHFCKKASEPCKPSFLHGPFQGIHSLALHSYRKALTSSSRFSPSSLKEQQSSESSGTGNSTGWANLFAHVSTAVETTSCLGVFESLTDEEVYLGGAARRMGQALWPGNQQAIDTPNTILVHGLPKRLPHLQGDERRWPMASFLAEPLSGWL